MAYQALGLGSSKMTVLVMTSELVETRLTITL